MRQLVTRDPRDPDFPHGTPAGRQRGCTSDFPCPSTPTCAQARARQLKRNALLRERGNPGLADAAPAFAHTDRLVRAVTGASVHAVLKVAGVPRSSYNRAQKHGRLHRDSARAILAVTPEALAEYVDRYPAEELMHMVRSMEAAGFPAAWIAQRTGKSHLGNWLSREHKRGYAQGHMYRPIKELFDHLDGRLASPQRDGLSSRAIALAQTAGRRAGYYPPSCYDDDGNLNPRFVPEHPWSQLDELCAVALDVAHDLTRVHAEYDLTDVAEAHGWGHKRVDRLWKRLGMRSHAVGQPGIHDDCKPTAARIRGVYADYDTRRIGPVTAALLLNLYDPDYLAKNYDRHHPELLAWNRQEATAA